MTTVTSVCTALAAEVVRAGLWATAGPYDGGFLKVLSDQREVNYFTIFADTDTGQVAEVYVWSDGRVQLHAFKRDAVWLRLRLLRGDYDRVELRLDDPGFLDQFRAWLDQLRERKP